MNNTKRIVSHFQPVACFGGNLIDVDGVTVEQVGPDRFYIAMGFPGFNSPANNRNGYKSAALAVSACRKYAAK